MPKLGLVGAGIATLLAQIFGYLIMRGYIAASRNFAARIERQRVLEFLRYGLPMSLQYIAESSAIGVTGILVGLLGSAALAANQVALSLGELIYMVPLGISGAIGILVAQATGKTAYKRVRVIGIASFVLVMLVTLPFTVAMVIYGGKIAAVFVDDRAVISVLTVLLATIAAVQIFDGLQSVALGALRGLLDNRWPTCITLVAYWLVAVPLSVVLGFVMNFGPAGVWCGFGIGVAFASALLIHRFMRQTKRFAGIHN
jgi:MATE family multidrug resistance protein